MAKWGGGGFSTALVLIKVRVLGLSVCDLAGAIIDELVVWSHCDPALSRVQWRSLTGCSNTRSVRLVEAHSSRQRHQTIWSAR